MGSAVQRGFATLQLWSFDACFEIAKPSNAAITTGPAPRLLTIEPNRKPNAPGINAAPIGWLSRTGSGRIPPSARPTFGWTSVRVSCSSWRASLRSIWIAEICSSVVMFSIVVVSAASFCTLRVLAVAIAGDQADDKTGGCPAQRDPSHDGQQRKPDTAVGSSAEDESRRAGDRQRRQRFLPDEFAEVAFPPAQPLIRIRRDGLCRTIHRARAPAQETRRTICAAT